MSGRGMPEKWRPSNPSEDDDGDMYDQLMSRALWVDPSALEELEDAEIAEPTTAEEYLALVRRERRSLPAVVSKRPVINEEEKAKKWVPTKFDFPFVSLVPAPPGYATTGKWERSRMKKFSYLRLKLTEWRSVYEKLERLSDYHTQVRRLRASDWYSKAFPDVSEQELMEGADVDDASMEEGDKPAQERINSMSVVPMCTVFWPKTSGKKGLTDEDDGPLEGERVLTEVDDPSLYGHLPCLGDIFAMPQFRVWELLGMHVEHMRDKGFSHFQGRWFFALMLALEKPLMPDTISTLREVAKLCSIYRSRLPTKEHSLLPSFNLLIALVARYFDQLDLMDENERKELQA